MGRSLAHLATVCAFALVLLSPVTWAADPENDLAEVLRNTKSRLLQAGQARLEPMETETTGERDTSSSEDFVLGVRNRSVHEYASRSTGAAADVPVPSQEPRSTLEPTYEPDYSIGEWWDGASQTTKTWTIVGAVAAFLIIFL